jgi:hypothetical protein
MYIKDTVDCMQVPMGLVSKLIRQDDNTVLLEFKNTRYEINVCEYLLLVLMAIICVHDALL